ncbi:MAG: hypothetical protein GY926_11470 [bacterium]|nr:hypothetical protein [bacterium]MCP4965846.1 hypothetical protein [bacterium]
MKLDTIARRHIEQAHHSVQRAHQPDIKDLAASPSRAITRISWVAAAVVAVAAGVIGAVIFVGSGTSVLESEPPAGNTTHAPTTAPATTTPDESVLLAEPLVTQAPLGPEPSVATSSYGVEQPLQPVDGLSLFERDLLGRDTSLIMEQRVAIGVVPGTSRMMLAATGTINHPSEPGFGSAGRCYWVSGANEATGDCHSLAGVEPVRPIGNGLGGRDWVGWSYLPDEASVAVLAVDSVDRFWQRPRADIALFAFTLEPGVSVELRVLDANGTEIARGDMTPSPDPGESTIVPVTGYRDFSTTDYWDIDWVEVTALTAQCLADQGFPVTITDGGVGMSFGSIPENQNRNAQIASETCQAGLNIPDAETPTQGQLADHYQALLETKQCLEERGYTIDEPPPVDEWIASYDFGPWHPYDSLDDEIASRIHTACPQP